MVLDKIQSAVGSKAFQTLAVGLPSLVAFFGEAGKGGGDFIQTVVFTIDRAFNFQKSSVFASGAGAPKQWQSVILNLWRNITTSQGVVAGLVMVFVSILAKAFLQDATSAMGLSGLGRVAAVRRSQPAQSSAAPGARARRSASELAAQSKSSSIFS